MRHGFWDAHSLNEKIQWRDDEAKSEMLINFMKQFTARFKEKEAFEPGQSQSIARQISAQSDSVCESFC
jgi:hypothetical protein